MGNKVSRKYSVGYLFIIAAAALFVFILMENSLVQTRQKIYEQQIEAARTMKEGLELIKSLQLSMGIPIDNVVDPNGTGLVGEVKVGVSPVAADLEAKRTSTNPAFAALFVKYFVDAGLKTDDVIAIGADGTYPALLVAVLAAAKSMGLKPLLIYSLGIPIYGDQVPELIFLQLLEALNQRRFLPYKLTGVALSQSGELIDGVSRQGAKGINVKVANPKGAPVLLEKSVAESISQRLWLYEQNADGEKIKCFINIGSNSANYGMTVSSLSFPNGLVKHIHPIGLTAESGLIFQYVQMGIPVVHLLNLRDIAQMHGLPIDPVPIPPVGTGEIYSKTRDADFLLMASGALLILIIGVPALRFLK